MKSNCAYAVILAVVLCCMPAGATTSETLPFVAGQVLPIESGIGAVVVEDLVVKPGKNTFMGRTQTLGEVVIKNRSHKKLQITVVIILFDSKLNIVSAGNYSSVAGFGGFEPNKSSTEKIQLGYIQNIEDVAFYQYRIMGFFEDEPTP